MTICRCEYHSEGFSSPLSKNPSWIYTAVSERRGMLVTVDGEEVVPAALHNSIFLFNHFIETGKGIGVCDDQATVVGAFLKSWGTSTNFVSKIRKGEPYGDQGHTFNIYYDPDSRMWTGYRGQLSTKGTKYTIVDPINFYVFRPPWCKLDTSGTSENILTVS